MVQRDPKLNPFDPRNPAYWLRHQTLGTQQSTYGYTTAGRWGWSMPTTKMNVVSSFDKELMTDWSNRLTPIKDDLTPDMEWALANVPGEGLKEALSEYFAELPPTESFETVARDMFKRLAASQVHKQHPVVQ